jgi:pyridoxamine 5'-phosphate oxidase
MTQHHLHIADIRKDYILASLDEATIGEEPMFFFKRWFDEAITAAVHEPNAMTLATVDALCKPHARIVLLKGIDDGSFTFFTNYDSDKGKELAVNNNAALVFFWPELERQVRIEGTVIKASAEESDEYFHSRPAGSRLGAWASPQSHIIVDRSVIEQQQLKFAQKYPELDIPRPKHWGGYKLSATRFEFWQGRASRLHDRICFEQNEQGVWNKFRLAP